MGALMAWVKIDDQFSQHPKVALAGPLASWLYVCGLCYCNKFLTDGVIPERIVPTLADFSGIKIEANDEATSQANGEANAKQLASILVQVGLWEKTDAGFLIHDYLEFNPSRDEVLATREKRAASGRNGGKKSGEVRAAKQNRSKVLSKLPSKLEANGQAKHEPRIPIRVNEQIATQSGAEAPDGGTPKLEEAKGQNGKPQWVAKGPAQELVAWWADHSGAGIPAMFDAAVGAAQRLIKAGLTIEQAPQLYAYCAEFQSGVTLQKMAGQFDSWRAAATAPRRPPPKPPQSPRSATDLITTTGKFNPWGDYKDQQS